MKKPSHSPKPKKKASAKPLDDITPLGEPLIGDDPIDTDETTSTGAEDLAGEQFAVVGREDEASSSGHRVEAIEPDEEGNAEKLIEEGLHGYLHVSKKNLRKN
jgi:hypothetical protein